MRALKSVYHRLRQRYYGVREYAPPQAVTAKMRSLSDAGSQKLLDSLKSHYFTGSELYSQDFEVFRQTDAGRQDIEDHMRRRLTTFRSTAIPWISSLVDLSDKSVLEIGCGTGSSTVALAEQGAVVTAIDEDAGSLRAARVRADLYDLKPEFMQVNSSEAVMKFVPESFDIVGMFAVVEHMTLEERLKSIREAWGLLKPGGLLVVVEAPNRLWVEDTHTSGEDFYWWLPDDLALMWTSKTPRKSLRQAFEHDRPGERTRDRYQRLTRWGRGVSYHEFCLALGCQPEELPVASAMELYFREQRNDGQIHAHMWYRQYEEILHSRHPRIHGGFFLPYLDLAFRKPTTAPGSSRRSSTDASTRSATIATT